VVIGREIVMKKLVVLVALTFALGTAHQAVACDMGAITAYVASTVVAKTEPTSQPAAPPVTTDQPATPVTVGCAGNKC
jgi:cell division septation protein DedD